MELGRLAGGSRLISVCIIVILVYNIYGCAQTAADTLVAEMEDADEMPDAEPYTFWVRNLDDVRLEGKTAGDFYITNAVNYHKGLYYINSENQLYRQIYDFDAAAGKEINENVPDMLIAENVVHIDCDSPTTIILTQDGSVWTWGDNAYNQCGVPGQGYIEEPVCVTQDADTIWMQDLYFNNDLMDWTKSWQYTYNRGHFHNLVVRKKDGCLWACGKNIEGKNNWEQDGVTYTYEFMPCEIVQQQPIAYDGLNTYQAILCEYERAWEDENYTREQWQEVNDGFVRWNDSKEYASLRYSLSDLTGDGTAEA